MKLTFIIRVFKRLAQFDPLLDITKSTEETIKICVTNGAAVHNSKMEPAYCAEHPIHDHLNEALCLAYKVAKKPIPQP